MKNSILIGLKFQSMLPENEKPQYTEKYEGFFHLNQIGGNVENTTLHYIVRDHDMTRFEERKALGNKIGEFLNAKYGEGTVEVEIADTYYNMAEKIRPHMYLMDVAWHRDSGDQSGPRRHGWIETFLHGTSMSEPLYRRT